MIDLGCSKHYRQLLMLAVFAMCSMADGITADEPARLEKLRDSIFFDPVVIADDWRSVHLPLLSEGNRWRVPLAIISSDRSGCRTIAIRLYFAGSLDPFEEKVLEKSEVVYLSSSAGWEMKTVAKREAHLKDIAPLVSQAWRLVAEAEYGAQERHFALGENSEWFLVAGEVDPSSGKRRTQPRLAMALNPPPESEIIRLFNSVKAMVDSSATTNGGGAVDGR